MHAGVARYQTVLHSGFFEADRALAHSLLSNTDLSAEAIIAQLSAIASSTIHDDPPPAAPAPAPSKPLTDWERRVRAAAITRVSAGKETLAASLIANESISIADAVAQMHAAPARLQPFQPPPQKSASSFGPIDAPSSGQETSADGWRRAFAAAEARAAQIVRA